MPVASNETANTTGMLASSVVRAACGVEVSSRASVGSVSVEAGLEVPAIEDTKASGDISTEKASTLDRSIVREDASTLVAFVLTLKRFSSYRQTPLPAAWPSASTTNVTPLRPQVRLYRSQSSSGTAWL